MSARDLTSAKELDSAINGIFLEYEGFYQIWGGKYAPNIRLAGIKQIALGKSKMIENKLYFKDAHGIDQELEIKDNHNYYITRNPMRTATKRGTSHLWNISKIVLDIDVSDNHLPSTTYNREAEVMVDILERELVQKGKLPAFDWVFTGRGVHLHYAIDPIHSVKMRFLADIFITEAVNIVNNELMKHSNTTQYEVDIPASKNHAGLIRYAGINQKSGEAVKVYSENRLSDIDSLLEYVDRSKHNYKRIKPTYSLNLPTKKEAHQPPLNSHKAKNYTKGMNIRLEFLQDIRKEFSLDKGYRNKMCFLYFNNSLNNMRFDKAVSSLYKFNNNFTRPLNHRELNKLINHMKVRYEQEVENREQGKAWRMGEGLYRYKRKTIIETLGITAEEQEKIKEKFNYQKNHTPKAKQARKKQDLKRKTKRKARNDYILDKRLNVIKDKTTTNKEKAELLNVSISTIQRLKRQYKEHL